METKSYTKKELRKLTEATGYPMASIEKTMRLLDLLKAINAEAVKCVSRFLSFTESEIAYLEAAKAGEYRPELLFEDESAERIAENPAAKFYITKGA